MAVLTRHAFLCNFISRSTDHLFEKNLTTKFPKVFLRGIHRAPAPIKKKTLEAEQISLANKGFLRSYEQYEPHKNVSERLNELCIECGISINDDTHLEDPLLRFNLLTSCEDKFKHSIPNSILCSINTIGDLRTFYKTPVNSTVPLDAMRSMDLPKNLHVQYEYHRFLPETDTMFNGRTAFPKSSTIVTGLKYKKKYPGHVQRSPFSR